LKPSAHHADSGEDETAETDDSTRVYGESFERSHKCLSAGEVDRPLSVGDASEREGEQGWCQYTGRVDQFSIEAIEMRIEARMM
jgi:hypothetical protein